MSHTGVIKSFENVSLRHVSIKNWYGASALYGQWNESGSPSSAATVQPGVLAGRHDLAIRPCRLKTAETKLCTQSFEFCGMHSASMKLVLDHLNVLNPSTI